MKTATLLVTAAALVLMASVPNAAAHKTVYSPDNQVKFVYGHIGEPIYTFQKTGLDLGISENRTGGLPIQHLEAIDHDGNLNPTLKVWYVYAGQQLEITNNFTAQHGKPGWYTYPIMFTQPGAYSIKIQGVINGTQVDIVIPPAHEVKAMDNIMWPKKVDLPDEQAAQVAAMQTQINALQSKVASQNAKSPGFDGLLTGVVVALVVALVAMRRRHA